MNQWSRTPLRIAAIGALIIAFGLTGCGRKGALDPPPGGSLVGDAGAGDAPLAQDGKKHIPLDVLLD